MGGGGGGGGGGAAGLKRTFSRPFWSQFSLKIRRAPPLDRPLLSKAPILQEMNDDAGIKKKNKTIKIERELECLYNKD